MTNKGKAAYIKCQQNIRMHPFKEKIGLLIPSSSCDPEHGGNEMLGSLSDFELGITMRTSWQTPCIHLHVVKSPGMMLRE